MEKICLVLFAVCLVFSGCKPVDVNGDMKMSTNGAVIASFGDDKVIYVDENKVATIISKSGDVLSRTNLTEVAPISNTYNWKTSFPKHETDTLYANAQFIDDVIYYEYGVINGKTYGMAPYLQSSNGIKMLNIPCQSGFVYSSNDKKHIYCSGKVNASLAIWKAVTNENGLSTTVLVY